MGALPAAPAPTFSPAEPIVAVVAGAMEMEGAPISFSVPPIRTTARGGGGRRAASGRGGGGEPCSVNSDCTSVTSVDFEG
jgi:hypothetical protein